MSDDHTQPSGSEAPAGPAADGMRDEAASISPNSRIGSDNLIEGPVRFGRWASAEGSQVRASGQGRCAIIGTELVCSTAWDVRAIDSHLTESVAELSALSHVSANLCRVRLSKLNGLPGGEDGPLLTLDETKISHTALVHSAGTSQPGSDRKLQLSRSVLADVSLNGRGVLRDSTLLATTLTGRVTAHDCFCAPAHYRPDTKQTTGRGADLNRILQRLDALPGIQDRAWPTASADSCHTDQTTRPLIADSAVTSSWITGTVTGSRVHASHIDGIARDSQVTDSSVSTTGRVRGGADVTGSTIRGTVVGGNVDGATVPESAFVGPDAEVLADSHLAVATIHGEFHTAYRTIGDGVSVVDAAGRTVDFAHGPAAELALQVSSSFDPLVDLSVNIGLDPRPNDYPLLP